MKLIKHKFPEAYEIEQGSGTIRLIGVQIANRPVYTKAFHSNSSRFRIRAVIFDDVNVDGREAAWPVAESTTLESCKEVLEVTGESALPLIEIGDYVLVTDCLRSILDLDAYRRHVLVLRLDTGKTIVKRLGQTIGKSGKIRMVENIGIEGQSALVRFAEEVSRDFRNLPLVTEARAVKGVWFRN